MIRWEKNLDLQVKNELNGKTIYLTLKTKAKRLGAPTLIFSSIVSVASHVLTKLAEVTMTVRVPPFVKGHFTRKPVHAKNLLSFPTHDKFDH